MSSVEIPEVVRARAVEAGVGYWLDDVPGLLDELAGRWHLRYGSPYAEGTEAFVVAATIIDGPSAGVEAVLKLGVPHDEVTLVREALVLRLADGDGAARLIEEAPEHRALLLERLGPSMFQLDLPLAERHALLVQAAKALWRPVDPAVDLPTGRWKAGWLAELIEREWERLGRPCSEAAVEHALDCARRREAAHDDERSVLVHGDVHRWNALQTLDGAGFKLVDPDGLRAEPAYDLGVMLREDPDELLRRGGSPWPWAEAFAAATGLDATAIFEWGVVERTSTGLLGVAIDLQPESGQMLEVADLVADRHRSPR